MEKDLISVIIPIYNAEKYISKMMKALSKQTYSNIEIILVDERIALFRYVKSMQVN